MVFDPGKPFQSSLTFAGKEGAYQSEAPLSNSRGIIYSCKMFIIQATVGQNSNPYYISLAFSALQRITHLKQHNIVIFLRRRLVCAAIYIMQKDRLHFPSF